MKRKLVYTLAGTVALSSVSAANVAMVFANENTVKVEQTIQIKSAQEFVNKYCSLQKMDTKGNLINEYELITTITEKNYQVILSGKTVYDTLSDSLKQEVNALIQKQLANVISPTYTTYDGMVAAAQNMDASIKQAQEQTKTDSNSTITPENKETNVQPQIPTEEKKETSSEEIKKEDTSEQVTKEDTSKEETKKEDSKENTSEATKEDSSNKVDKEEDAAAKEAVATKEDVVVIDNTFTVDANEVQFIDNKYAITTMDLFPEVVSYTTGIEKAASTETEKVEVEVPVTLETLSQPVVTQAQEVTTTNVAKEKSTSSDTSAQDFVDTYLTSSAGNVYTQANSLNYTNIINGLSDWTKLSSSQREAVNAILKKKVGKTYQTLLKEAQQIQYNGVTSSYTGKSTKVNTAVGNESGFYGALMGISIAVGAFLTRKRKEQD